MIVQELYSQRTQRIASRLFSIELRAEGSWQRATGVSESIVPVVKANVGKHIDVVVVRIASESGQVQQVSLSLTPQKWSGAGLLGCILK